jgi:hypothetical protein
VRDESVAVQCQLIFELAGLGICANEDEEGALPGRGAERSGGNWPLVVRPGVIVRPRRPRWPRPRRERRRRPRRRRRGAHAMHAVSAAAFGAHGGVGTGDDPAGCAPGHRRASRHCVALRLVHDARVRNLYPGTGLIVDMGRPVTVTAVQVTLGAARARTSRSASATSRPSRPWPRSRLRPVRRGGPVDAGQPRPGTLRAGLVDQTPAGNYKAEICGIAVKGASVSVGREGLAGAGRSYQADQSWAMRARLSSIRESAHGENV